MLLNVRPRHNVAGADGSIPNALCSTKKAVGRIGRYACLELLSVEAIKGFTRLLLGSPVVAAVDGLTRATTSSP